MAMMTVNCPDPNDLMALEKTLEEMAGRCNITYAKQHEAMVDAGTSKSQRESAKKIAAETGESVSAVLHRIQRGTEVIHGGSPVKKPPPQLKHTDECTEAHQFITMAISQLERIRDDDPKRDDELLRVATWIVTKGCSSDERRVKLARAARGSTLVPVRIKIALSVLKSAFQSATDPDWTATRLKIFRSNIREATRMIFK